MKMNADIRWIDNPEIFRVNQIAAHSDHDYFTNYEALNSNSHMDSGNFVLAEMR